MEKSIFIIFIGLLLLSCKSNPPKIIQTDDYELIIPNNPEAILILFPGFGGDAKRIKQESKIPQEAINNQIAVMLFNSYNHHLYLTKKEAYDIEETIFEPIKKYNLKKLNIFLGGFSSGGNIAFSLIMNIDTKGVFIIDAPIDLSNLYFRNEKSLKQSLNKNTISESKFILNYLNTKLGNPNENLGKYEDNSMYTSISNFGNLQLSLLNDIAIKVYTEPDLKWWNKYNGITKFSELNSYSLKKMYNELIENKHQNIEYIETKNKGYRANGKRHPHSWSIVDEKEIVKWILKNN